MYIYAFQLQVLCLLGLAYVGCDRTLAVFLLICATGLSGLSISGYMSNHLDIAPDYAGDGANDNDDDNDYHVGLSNL